MEITIDTTRCIGCGMCAAAVPSVFVIVGKYSTVTGLPEGKLIWKAMDAKNGCPVNAITIVRG